MLRKRKITHSPSATTATAAAAATASSSTEQAPKKIKMDPSPENGNEQQEDKQMKTETEDFDKVKTFYKEHLNGSNKKGSIRTMCSEHLESMEGIIKDFRGKVVVTLFCKPGYGKSFIIDQLLSDFKMTNAPLPSAVQFGKGLTRTVVDVEYSPTYSLTVQYCSQQELCARKVEQLATDTLKDCEIDNQSNYIIDNGNSEEELYEFLATKARNKILEFDADTNFKKVHIKKLILKIPSKFLQRSKIILRDMPGYDEKQTTDPVNVHENVSYKHLIRESLYDTCLLLCGIENERIILDDGIVQKVWDYGIHQPQQTHQPYIAILANNKVMNEESYKNEVMTKNVFKPMKESYGKQLAFHFDCELDDVPFDLELEANNINTNEIDMENKYDFVKGLYDNFDLVCFPPPNNVEMRDHFVSNLQSIIENNRKKIISNNISQLRDMAIVVLSNTTIKKVQKFPLKFVKELKSCIQKIQKKLQSVIDGLKENIPDVDALKEKTIDSFVKKFSSYYTNPIVLGFQRKEIVPELKKTKQKKLNQLKVPQRIKRWKQCFGYFNSGFFLKLESFLSCFNTLTKRFQAKLTSILQESYLRSDTIIPLEWVQSLCYSLNPNFEEKDKSKEKIILDIVQAVEDFEHDFSVQFEETVQSWEELSFGLHKNVKQLLTKYQNKKSSIGEVIIEDKYPFPQRLEECKLDLPDKESESVTDLRPPVPEKKEKKKKEKKKAKKQEKQKSFCSHNDALLKFKFEKRDRYTIPVKVMDRNYSNDNEILVKFNRDDEILEISYNEESFLTKLKQISTLTSDGLKPLFIKSRPRGKFWKPYLYSNFVKKLHSDSIPNCVTIVTESKYINRYKKWIISNGNRVDDYNFIVLESNMPLGPGIVHSSILAIGQFLKLECIHIIQDDILEFYEYSRQQKLFVSHETSMLRSLQFMEKVLHTELFNPNVSRVRFAKLKEILLEPEFAANCLKILKLKYNLTDQIIEELGNGRFHLLDILDEYIKSIKGPSRKKYNSRITEITNEVSSESTLKLIIHNPQQFIELLKEIQLNNPDIQIARFLVEQLESIFDNKKHIGRVAMWNYQVNDSLKNKIHNLKRPTHTISYLTSAVNTYFLPSMEGILPISSDDFWEEPENQLRKETLLTVSANPGKKNPTPTKKEAAERGWCELEICEKTQMLLNGVGGFQVFCFGYTSSMNPSLINYKAKKRVDFDSDEENEEEEEDNIDDNGDSDPEEEETMKVEEEDDYGDASTDSD
ncbi:predicted protein [Naegleria gruberi]|uniref:Predicted protein n=1 Tax=Naegleria gruberi TaxID=5762 RepID=D2VFP1_NAEGR|nr:uncharacterized protein NAEGRDRAFT_49157 [Naegleria gruberi]EFC44504.1 predicted protein [Naegleria gruberi]|eukprot:XP_002677248.1 predicted protein [Naegleria gruberi strain NEG-M]